MKSFRSLLLALAVFISAADAFAPLSGAGGGSAFVVSQKASAAVASPQHSRSSAKSALYMGNNAKFGVFSPAVYAAKVALGQDKLNKLRGKGISLHSQAIGDFCEWAGAYHLRTRLIKKAKTNGDILGFLV